MAVKKLGKHLHRHFIPSRHNDYKPHFLRLRVTLGLIAVVFLFEALYLVNIYVVLPRSDFFAAIFASALVEQTNIARAGEELATLTVNPLLEKAAQLKANDMAEKGYFAHNAPDGTTPWHWFREAGYKYAAAGENLAVNFTDSKDVTVAWLNSPTHRANIMSGRYTEIGIATAHGTYKGREAIFVVQEFGRPQAQVTVSQPPVVAKPTAQPKTAAAPATPAPSVPAPAVTPTPAQASPQPVSTSQSVAGAEIVETATPIEEAPAPIALEIEVAPLEQNVVQTARAPISELLASPRHVSTVFFLLLGAFFLVALGLAVFVEIKVQHPHIIANGLILVMLVVSLVVLNNSLASGTIGGIF